jgi:hypothetical protein
LIELLMGSFDQVDAYSVGEKEQVEQDVSDLSAE